MAVLQIAFISLQLILGCLGADRDSKFPKNFKFGAGTAAFAVEGGWNEDGKGESIWDHFLHVNPEVIKSDDHCAVTKQAEVAADSYHKWREDVEVAKKIGIDFYSFSISWQRILPRGEQNPLNQAGVDYYNNLIDALVAANITPYTSLHHYDTPQIDSYFGGFSSKISIARFVKYADLAFHLFGDRVKHWITIVAPYKYCNIMHGQIFANASHSFPTGEYEYYCGHNVILAHARAYRLYQKKYKKSQKGEIGIPLVTDWYEPASNCSQDIEASKRALDFQLGWFAHPLVYGNYPQRMIDTVAEVSRRQNYSCSRLPSFTKTESEEIKGTFDFIPFLPVQTWLVSDNKEIIFPPTLKNDVQISRRIEPEWKDPNCLYVDTTWGFRKAVKYFWDNYKQPRILIVKHIYGAFQDSLNDDYRIKFLHDYLENILLLIHEDKVCIEGFMAWSLIDLFYFQYGYEAMFGLAQVDFNDPKRPRTLKSSASIGKTAYELSPVHFIGRTIEHPEPPNIDKEKKDDLALKNKSRRQKISRRLRRRAHVCQTNTRVSMAGNTADEIRGLVQK